jgi:hypothetical protein
MILAVSEAPDYAFPHSAQDESRRLELLEQRLDPLTKRRIEHCGVSKGARCLEIGGGEGRSPGGCPMWPARSAA